MDNLERTHLTRGVAVVYVAVAFVQGAVALLGWHLAQRFSMAFGPGVLRFSLRCLAVLTSQDYLIANSPSSGFR